MAKYLLFICQGIVQATQKNTLKNVVFKQAMDEISVHFEGENFNLNLFECKKATKSK
ncbi:hypothetical protein [Flavobacterium sp. ZT3R18]|uniref:hypothetical protein n=1 Tax=Flavobacterium sp. ZT3R18 TaxID=2594429 RepID=UPI00163D3F9A|nr:hypothetical protein [Flavobacterium sp. ZT3R18]